MHGISRWTPSPAWSSYSSHRGPREYRHGFRGHLWALIRADRARDLLPLLGGTVPGPRLGKVPVFYPVRLDCAGRLDRVLGDPCPLKAAGDLCDADTVLVAEYEARDFTRTGRRPLWERLPRGSRMITLDERAGTMGSAPLHPVVLRSARLTWRMRRFRDTWTLTRRAQGTGDPDDTSGWPTLNQGAAFWSPV